jgi:hypothetical protein
MASNVEVLFQDGYFRIVRVRGDLSSDGPWIQHEHTTEPVESNIFDNGKWVYCYYGGMCCKLCETKVPQKMQGLMALMDWDR